MAWRGVTEAESDVYECLLMMALHASKIDEMTNLHSLTYLMFSKVCHTKASCNFMQFTFSSSGVLTCYLEFCEALENFDFRLNALASITNDSYRFLWLLHPGCSVELIILAI